MKRKFLIFLIAITALVAIGTVSAEYHENNGFGFNVPDGYTYSDSGVSLSYLGTEPGNADTYTKGDSEITVSVIPIDPSNTIDDFRDVAPSGYADKKIGDIEGLMKKLDDGTYSFTFIKDGKQIFVNAPDEETIEEVLA